MRRDLGLGLLLAALTLAVFWPVRTHDFIVYDDPQFVTENTQVQSGLSWETLVYAFSTPVVGNWHPITTLSHALDCELFGLSPGAHHLVNALLHALNAGLLFLVLQQLTSGQDGGRAASAGSGESQPPGTESAHLGGGSFAGRNFVIAALFALHPLRVESVAWLAERKDLLAGFFFLLSLWMYARYARARASSGQVTGARGFYLGCWLSFAFGLMSKPMVVTLPFVLLLLDFWPLQRTMISNFKSQISDPSHPSHGAGAVERPTFLALLYEKLPFFALSAVACWVTLLVQASAGAMQVIQGIDWPERLSNAITSYVRYLGKLVWPIDLAVIYPHPAKHYYLSGAWPGWEIGVGALLLLLISLFCVTQLRQRPCLAVGWCWFLGTLVPVIGLVQVGEQAMADRYTYIPLIGPVMALVWGACELMKSIGPAPSLSPRRGTPLRAGRARGLIFQAGTILVLLCLLVLLTRQQLGYWQNTVTLFEHTIAVTPDNPSAQFALGVGLEGQGRPNQAIVRYRVAVAIDPQYAKAYYNMGQVLRKAGRWQNAAQAYRAAARCNPKDLVTQLNLAGVLSHLDQVSEAIDHFNQALELDPNSVEGLNNLAWLLCTSPAPQFRDGTRAVQLAERACWLTGYQAPVFLGTLAAAYAEAGRFPEAVATAQNAAALAAQAGDSAAASKNRQLAGLYRAHKPYRDPHY